MRVGSPFTSRDCRRSKASCPGTDQGLVRRARRNDAETGRRGARAPGRGNMAVVVFANNQTLVTVQGTNAVIFTDPVSLNGNDRLSAMLNTHSIVKGGTVTTGTLTYVAQISNDGGQNYVDSTTVLDNTTAAGVRQ